MWKPLEIGSAPNAGESVIVAFACTVDTCIVKLDYSSWSTTRVYELLSTCLCFIFIPKCNVV